MNVRIGVAVNILRSRERVLAVTIRVLVVGNIRIKVAVSVPRSRKRVLAVTVR
jgi:hypothetical protein